MKTSLDIVIVNWNSGTQLQECLSSISKADKRNVQLEHVVVVDNASTDGSATALRVIDIPLSIIRNPENRGFAAACNQGAQDSQATYLLFLNPDTVLHTDSLLAPTAFLNDPSNARVGICGIQLLDDSGRVARSCSRFPTTLMFASKMLGLQGLLSPELGRQAMTEWDHANSRDVDQVIGAFFLVRRTVFEDLHGFDERFFVYFEEVDFARRAAAKGIRSHYLATAQAAHRGGGCSNQVRARRLTYNLQSRMEYALKHFSRPSALALVVGTLFIEPVARVAAALLRASVSDSSETLAAYQSIWTHGLRSLSRALGVRRRQTSRPS